MAKSEKYSVSIVSVGPSGQSFTGDDDKVYHSSSFAPAAVKNAMQTLEVGMTVEVEAAYSEKTSKYYVNGLTVTGRIPAPASSMLGKAAEFVKESLTEMASLIVDGTPTPPGSSAKVENAAPTKPAEAKPSAPEAETKPAPYVNPQQMKDDRISRMACLNTATAVLQAHGTLARNSALEAVDSVLKLASLFERAVHQGFKPVMEEIKPQVDKLRATVKKPPVDSEGSQVEDRHSVPFGGRR